MSEIGFTRRAAMFIAVGVLAGGCSSGNNLDDHEGVPADQPDPAFDTPYSTSDNDAIKAHSIYVDGQRFRYYDPGYAEDAEKNEFIDIYPSPDVTLCEGPDMVIITSGQDQQRFYAFGHTACADGRITPSDFPHELR